MSGRPALQCGTLQKHTACQNRLTEHWNTKTHSEYSLEHICRQRANLNTVAVSLVFSCWGALWSLVCLRQVAHWPALTVRQQGVREGGGWGKKVAESTGEFTVWFAGGEIIGGQDWGINRWALGIIPLLKFSRLGIVIWPSSLISDLTYIWGVT